ncbi:MAG: hypothetical protein D6798_06925 [Deltaproteobacteria bacterium]|nr:MAG: hypothetical protein D6798_06925 [Deltaproteobacteria bacterium]
MRSLCFQGDTLVHLVGGGRVLGLDGSQRWLPASWADHFDSAVLAPAGRYAVLFERLGTRAPLVDVTTGQCLRPLHRSDYHASAYVYPVTLWTSASGHTLLAHCPDQYNRIEIDNLDTNQRLTASPDRQPGDYFHSRLAANPSGTRLLSAGWVWHPWDFVGWTDLRRVREEPTVLDRLQVTPGAFHVGLAEQASATWLSDDLLLVGSSDELEDPDEAAEAGDSLRLMSPGLAVVDVRRAAVVQSVPLPYPPGAMMPVGPDRVVTFYGHPRLVRLRDGHLLHEWPDLDTGRLTGSIQHHLSPPPPMAIDPRGRRFAVASSDSVAVVDLSAW